MGRELDKIIEEVKEFLLSIQGIKIEKAILFGSWVRGDWMKWSDVDLILVSPDFEGIRFTERPVTLCEFWNHSRGLELFCYTPEEFERNRKDIGLVADAEKTGVVIKDGKIS